MTFRGHKTIHHWTIANSIWNREYQYDALMRTVEEGGTLEAQTKRLMADLPDMIDGSEVTFDRVKAVVKAENEAKQEWESRQ